MSAFDVSALRKYDVAGPRYTSYPTAPMFNDSYTGADWLVDLGRRDPERGVSLYVHLPYCDTLCYFCGCNMKVSNDREAVASYLDLLEDEIAALAPRLEGVPVRQLHWGGGTPTHLTPDEIRRLGRFLRDQFVFAADAECGVEIDPRGIGEDTIAALAEVGFNRASMGVQDFEPAVQQAVNRINSPELVQEVAGWIRDHGFESLNFDLMYGLPHQSRDTFDRTVDTILGLHPDRLALFNFAYLPGMIKHQKVIDPDALPGPEEKISIFESAGQRLTGAGLDFIGMDHFARHTDSLAVARREGTLRRNFQGYSTSGDLDIIAFGASGISELEGCYAQNIKDLPDWRAAVGNGRLPTVARGYRLTDEDRERRDLIFSLMCQFELDTDAFGRRWSCDFHAKYAAALAALAPLVDDGCLEITSTGLKVTDRGIVVIRNIVMVFDEHLDALRAGGSRFSRTI